jgi:hypothetical protein
MYGLLRMSIALSLTPSVLASYARESSLHESFYVSFDRRSSMRYSSMRSIIGSIAILGAICSAELLRMSSSSSH